MKNAEQIGSLGLAKETKERENLAKAKALMLMQS
jgi:hypothetical protein